MSIHERDLILRHSASKTQRKGKRKMTNEEYMKMVADAAAREEKRTADFLKAVERGEYIYFSRGSERGYLAKSVYPNGKFCGMVSSGFRRGLYKFQKSGKGGPYGNSTNYISNIYYRKVI